MKHFYREEEDGKIVVGAGSIVPPNSLEYQLDAVPTEVETHLKKAVEQSEVNKEILEAKKYLRDTDWYVVRNTETGKAIPEEISTKRAEARDKL